MFSAKLIQKQVEKDTRTPDSKSSNTPKKKKKNVKGGAKADTTKKKNRHPLRSIAASDQTPAQTDVNSNKVMLYTHTRSIATDRQPASHKVTKIKKKRRARKDTKAKTDPGVGEITEGVDKPGSTDLPALYTEGEWGGKYKWEKSASESDSISPLDYTASPKTAMEQSSDSEHSTTGTKHKRRSNASRHNARNSDREDRDDKEARAILKLVGECLAVTKTERGSVVAALAPDTTLYLQGCVVVCPLLGSAEVLGYNLQQGQSQPLYSLPSCSLLGVTALAGVQVDPSHPSLQGLPPPWLEGLAKKNSQVMLLEVRRYSSPCVDFLVKAGSGFLGQCREWQEPWHAVGASTVTRGNCHKNRIIHILPEWKEAAQTVAMNWKCGAVPRVVVGGGKGVGKSTFFKYLANSLLSAQPDGPHPGVLCLDLDPGQPELSMPTSLSLTRLTKPLLGPPYTHDLQGLSDHRTHVLVGDVSPQFVVHRYVDAVAALCREVDDGVPLLVNTMGWTQGTGLGLMLDVLRLVRPSHLMQIQDRMAKRNFPFPLEGSAVSRAKGGITTRAGDCEMHYSLTLLPSGGQRGPAMHMAQPRALREMRVLAEAGRVVQRGRRVTLPWSSLALHVCGEQVPRNRILQALNAQLVALCHLDDPSSLHSLHQDLPQVLAPHARFGAVVGWGVVTAMDPLTRTLQLATDLPLEQVTREVGALVMPRMHLPVSFYKQFCVGKGPFLGGVSREGAGRLRVGRHIKPRGRRD
ncbi:Polynucleotide 5'-hydroxyl-kinase NOL9 [Chionoecetes opilio]|uniref:Polynucleotide 5'-hydroxyl-kinase NOL9 n=1 Tax=Chionoecetes opilio TaxID=41210 RepID=A0A8J5CEX0_CHIOP|nr:Polynucleotide 5'-hydroxyl-kinase NOL9 [Chionoecetes opilio]